MRIKNLQKYIEFKSITEAKCWASKIFCGWFPKDQCICYTGNETPDAIKVYCGTLSRRINQMLRESTEHFSIYDDCVNRIGKEISKFILTDNIITYRVISKYQNDMPGTQYELMKGGAIVDDGFMSTGLVKENLLKAYPLAKQNVLLKIYVPAGTHGAYVNFLSVRNDEQEFLIPPKTTLRVIHKHRGIHGTVLICIVENQTLRFRENC